MPLGPLTTLRSASSSAGLSGGVRDIQTSTAEAACDFLNRKFPYARVEALFRRQAAKTVTLTYCLSTGGQNDLTSETSHVRVEVGDEMIDIIRGRVLRRAETTGSFHLLVVEKTGEDGGDLLGEGKHVAKELVLL